MFDSVHSKLAPRPLAWLRSLFSRTAANARLSELARRPKLPPITNVVDRTRREPQPRD